MEIQCCACYSQQQRIDIKLHTIEASKQTAAATVIVLLYLSHSIPFFSFPLLLLSSLSISQAKMDNSSSRRICFTYFAFILRKKANGQKMGGFPSLSLLHIIHFFTCHLSSCPQAGAAAAYSKPSSKLYNENAISMGPIFLQHFL